MFYIVDADAVILKDFDFSYVPPKHELDHVHVWRSQNPINDLVYGYGGLKLFPTKETLNMDTSKPDMTTSISDKFKLMQDISNVTAFNVDEFSTWRSAFRECTKLSSSIIEYGDNIDNEYRLNIWCTRGEKRPFGEYCIMGANQGREFGSHYSGQVNKLNKITLFTVIKTLVFRC